MFILLMFIGDFDCYPVSSCSTKQDNRTLNVLFIEFFSFLIAHGKFQLPCLYNCFQCQITFSETMWLDFSDKFSLSILVMNKDWLPSSGMAKIFSVSFVDSFMTSNIAVDCDPRFDLEDDFLPAIDEAADVFHFTHTTNVTFLEVMPLPKTYFIVLLKLPQNSFPSMNRI